MSGLLIAATLFVLINAESHATGRAVAQNVPASSLKIVVISGEDAVNIIQQKTAVSPIVEVRDRNDQPVSGALVTFAIRGGRASFSGAQSLTVATNAAGRAVVTGFTPSASGAVQITASAAFEGQTAVATIAQTNVMTAAQASAATGAGAAGGGGGGLSHSAIAAVLGGAGAIGTVVAVKGGDAPSAQPSISVTPGGAGIQDVTRFVFTGSGGSGSDSWDFGDGQTAAGAVVEHIFNREGSFRVMLRTSSGGSQPASVDVVVGTLTGQWTARITSVPSFHTHRVNIVQQGNALTGQWIVEYDFPAGFGGPGNPNVSQVGGNLSDPRGIRLTQGGDCQRILTGTLNTTLSSLGGALSIANPICIDTGALTLTLTRQ